MKIKLRVLAATEIRSMDCIVLGRLGDVYPCIVNGFHPHCGNKDNGYSEMYSAVDWMIDNRVNRACGAVNEWLGYELKKCYEEGLDFDFAVDLIFAGINPSSRTVKICEQIWDSIDQVTYDYQKWLTCCEDIDFYLNQNFLRVRAGGKLNPSSANSIYFRISSKDYNWRHVIEDFLWDTFESIKYMPEFIWIGHDAETNPPEIVLFEGSPEDLFNKSDSKIFATTKFE